MKSPPEPRAFFFLEKYDWDRFFPLENKCKIKNNFSFEIIFETNCRINSVCYSKSMKLISIGNDKGGVGKTVTALHLAALFAARGKTLLVDGDRNRSATDWVAAGPGLGFETVHLDDLSGSLDHFDFVVVDTKGGEESLLSLAKRSDFLVIPSKPEAVSLRVLMRTLETLKNEGVLYKVLLTDVPTYPSVDGHDARGMLLDAGIPLFGAEIRSSAAFRKAMIDGVTVREVKRDPRAKRAWMDYELVVKEILG